MDIIHFKYNCINIIFIYLPFSFILSLGTNIYLLFTIKLNNRLK